MALVQKKKERKERRSRWPLLVAIVLSVGCFLVFLGFAAFWTRNNDVTNPRAVAGPKALMTVELPSEVEKDIRDFVQKKVSPCVLEAIRLDPAAAPRATVKASLHLAAGEAFLDGITPFGFSSSYFQQCLARLRLPGAERSLTSSAGSPGASGQASIIIEVTK